MPISILSRDPSQLILEFEIQDLVKESISKNLLELFAVGCSDVEVWDELRALVGPTVVWVKSSQSHLQGLNLRSGWTANEKFSNKSEIYKGCKSNISCDSTAGNSSSNYFDGNHDKEISTNSNNSNRNRNRYSINSDCGGANSIGNKNSAGARLGVGVEVGGGGGGGGARVGFSLSEFSELSLEEVLGTEETVWCPPLGIKGQIDLVVKARILSNSVSPSSNINKKYNKSVIMPLELKTGKASMQIAHRAQVMLYVLMLFLREHSASDLTSEENSAPEKYTSGSGNPSERTCSVIKLEGPDPTRSMQLCPSTRGLLLYLNRDGTKCETITPKWQEICSLVISRNDLAGHIKQSNSLVSREDFSFMSV